MNDAKRRVTIFLFIRGDDARRYQVVYLFDIQLALFKLAPEREQTLDASFDPDKRYVSLGQLLFDILRDAPKRGFEIGPPFFHFLVKLFILFGVEVPK